MTDFRPPASLKSEQDPVMNYRLDSGAIRPLQDREIVHVIAAKRSGFADPKGYISHIIKRYNLSSDICNVFIDIDYDTSSIDDRFIEGGDLWQQAYDALDFDQEIWTFELPANKSDCEKMAEMRNHNGRPNFFSF